MKDQAAGVAEEEGSSNDTNVEAQDEQGIKRPNSEDDDEEEHSAVAVAVMSVRRKRLGCCKLYIRVYYYISFILYLF